MIRKTVFAAAFALVSLGAAPPQSAALVQSIARTADGAHVIGDPKAKAKLTEYMSYTCSHCAQFERDGADLVKLQFVGTGRLKFEIRHYILNVVDLTVATAAHCAPKEKFFTVHSNMLKRQGEWLPKASAATSAQQARWNAGTPQQRFAAVASDIGLYKTMENYGVSRVQLDKCFGDPSVYQPIVAQTRAAEARGIDSTPTFELNGTKLRANTAAGLGPVLVEATKR